VKTSYVEISAVDPPVPPGAPRWVTAALIDSTLAYWQSKYTKRLTRQDALSIIVRVSLLWEALESPGCDNEMTPRQD
jgi:hypothetical protein